MTPQQASELSDTIYKAMRMAEELGLRSLRQTLTLSYDQLIAIYSKEVKCCNIKKDDTVSKLEKLSKPKLII
jgi:hypothetical protein